ncbi:hypothetical protein WG906_10245 [Pedobacter sp. P351]|uniref:hypothetical protein n=1 Tax=Pedobacter superstes TaxID=3133441 RepID=UPI0030A41357
MFDDVEKLPVYQKAKEILFLAEHICEALKDDDQREHIEHQILSNAMIIGSRIAGAVGCDAYSLKMENAIKIKFAIKEMFEGVLFAHLININHNDYVTLMRNAVEEFRVIFIAWIRTFDVTNDCKDDWTIRYVIDTTDDFEMKMVSEEGKDYNDDDDPDTDWFDLDDDDL